MRLSVRCSHALRAWHLLFSGLNFQLSSFCALFSAILNLKTNTTPPHYSTIQLSSYLAIVEGSICFIAILLLTMSITISLCVVIKKTREVSRVNDYIICIKLYFNFQNCRLPLQQPVQPDILWNHTHLPHRDTHPVHSSFQDMCYLK